MYKNNQIKVLSNEKYSNGLECNEFDQMIENDIKNFTENIIPMEDSNATNHSENLRRLKLLKIAKKLCLNRNNYFDLSKSFKRNRYSKYGYSSKNPKYLELYELNKLLINCEYLRYLQKSKLVNDIRSRVFLKISENLLIDENTLNEVRETTRMPNTATSSSNAILSNNGSQNQERVKDSRLRNNSNLEKYQHNTKWVIYKNMKKHLDLDDHNNGVWQMPKMNGKYHTEFCLRYFIPNMIYNEHDRVYENSLYTMPELLNILLKIREYYNEYLLKVLKDNIINVFEGLSFDMQSILSPSFNNPRNINRAKGIRKIVNLPISRKEKIKMLMNFKYYNKFQEVIYPFLSSNKYKIIINSSYHFVKDTSLNPTEDNPNCVANGFFSKFKLSYGIYQVSNNSINFKNFCIIKNNSLKEIASQMHNILISNYYAGSFDYCVDLIQNIKNENDINEWSNITPVTMWLHEFLTFSDFSMRLCHKLFSGTVFKLKKIIDEYDQILRQIVTDEIYVRKNLVKQFLTKSNRKELNEIIYSGKNPSNDITEQILKLYDSILKQSSKKILKYLEVYMSIISTMSKNIDAHILFNHMISRFSYFMDTRCYIDTEMNSRFFKTSRNYAFPMFSKSFSSILKKKKSKITDQLFIESYATQVKQIICEIDTEELEISDNYSEDIVIEYFSDDEPNEN